MLLSKMTIKDTEVLCCSFVDEGFEDIEIIKKWRNALSRPRCEFERNSDLENQINDIELEKEEGQETWVRGDRKKLDNGTITLLDDDGYMERVEMLEGVKEGLGWGLKGDGLTLYSKGASIVGWRWIDADKAVVVRLPNKSIILLSDSKNLTTYLVSDGTAKKIPDKLIWGCKDGILVPEVQKLENNDNLDNSAIIKLPHNLKKQSWEVEKYQVARVQNMEERRRREKKWGAELVLVKNWLNEKVEEAKRAEGVLVFKNHFARDLDDNLVFPHSSCSRLSSVRLLPGSLPVRALVSYPGSGNTWMRDLVEAATGLHTGNERDWALGNKDWTLMKSMNDHQPGSDLLVKSHHMRFSRQGRRQATSEEDFDWRLDNIRYFGGEAVILLRSPWDALRSSWNHLQEKTDLDVGSPEFQRFAVEEIKKWRDIAIDWMATSPKLLVVHYEHLREDPEKELRRVVSFLGLEADEDRFSCMAGRKFEGFLRKRKALKKSPYWESTAAKVIHMSENMLMTSCR